MGRDESFPALQLCLLQGETLTSLLSLLPFAPKAKGGRIVVTMTGSSSRGVVEGLTPPTKTRGTPTDMARFHQPLRGEGLAIRSFVTCLFQVRVTDWDNLAINNGLLNRTPGIDSTHTHSRIKNKRHGRRGKCTLEWDRWLKERSKSKTKPRVVYATNRM